jgi:hypothetical protein
MARYNTINQTFTASGATSINSPNVGLVTSFTGAAPYTVTLPNPALYLGTLQTFYNATSGTITVSTSNGIIKGPGAGAQTFGVVAGSTITLASDGTDYILVDNLGGALHGVSANISGQAVISDSTASTTTGTGALVVSGGAGIGGAVNVGGAGAFVGLSSSSGLTVSSGSASLGSSVDINGGNIDGTAIGAASTSTAKFTTLEASGITKITNTTASSSADSGALQVDGGVGVNGNVYTGGVVYSGTTSYTRIATGTTAQRPTGANGYLRYNTSTKLPEYADGTTWISMAKGFIHQDVSSNITANTWYCYWVDTAGGSRTITLPNSGLSKGDTIRFFDLRKTFDSNALTIGRNGQIIQGDSADLTVNTESAAFDLVYHGTTYGWRIFTV